METSSRQITFTPDLFEPVERSPEEAEKIRGAPVGFWGDAWRRLKRNRIAVAAGGVIILIIVLAFVGPLLTPYTSIGQDLGRQYETPSLSGFWFGTDEFGRSMFDRVWVCTRVSLYIAALVTIMDMCVGMAYGALSGYDGGRVDNIMQRIVEILVGIPILIVAILTMLILEPGILSLTIAIGLTGWTSSARLIRGQVLRLKEQEFFLASRSLGANTFRLISKHLLPNVFYILIITLMYTVPTAVFFEAFLELYRARHTAARRLTRGPDQRRCPPDEVLSLHAHISGRWAGHDHHQLQAPWRRPARCTRPEDEAVAWRP